LAQSLGWCLPNEVFKDEQEELIRQLARARGHAHSSGGRAARLFALCVARKIVPFAWSLSQKTDSKFLVHNCLSSARNEKFETFFVYPAT
jgi:hypothetical protein